MVYYLILLLYSLFLCYFIKDEAGKIANMENNRPLALASILSKVLKQIILDRPCLPKKSQ